MRCVQCWVCCQPCWPPGKLGALLVPVEELNDLVGAKLGFEQQFNRPAAPAGGLGDKSACAVLFGSNSDSYASEYTAFRRVSVRDGEDSSQHFVAQEVAAFADLDTATANFGKAFDKTALAGCNDAVVHRQGEDDRITWRLNVTAVNTLTKKGTAYMRFTMEVNGIKQVQRAITLIREVSGVIDAQRK